MMQASKGATLNALAQEAAIYDSVVDRVFAKSAVMEVDATQKERKKGTGSREAYLGIQPRTDKKERTHEPSPQIWLPALAVVSVRHI